MPQLLCVNYACRGSGRKLLLCISWYIISHFFQPLNWWIWCIADHFTVPSSTPTPAIITVNSAKEPHDSTCEKKSFLKKMQGKSGAKQVCFLKDSLYTLRKQVLQCSSGIESVSFFHKIGFWMIFYANVVFFSIVDNPQGYPYLTGFIAFILQENHEFSVKGNNCSQQ